MNERSVRSLPACLRVAGEFLVSCGLVVLLFLAYMYWGTAERTRSVQNQLASELHSEWAAPQTGLAALTDQGRLALGQPIALIRIPRFGKGWQFAIVQGTGLGRCICRSIRLAWAERRNAGRPRYDMQVRPAPSPPSGAGLLALRDPGRPPALVTAGVTGLASSLASSRWGSGTARWRPAASWKPSAGRCKS